MRAGELAAPFPTVGLDTPAVEAARLLAGQNLPGLIVVDGDGRPYTVLPGTQVLRMAVPPYCQDDPALARAALMARARSPQVAVAEAAGRMRGAVTLDAPLDRMLAS